MNILIIHNVYSQRGGEEGVVALQQSILKARGDSVFTYFRRYDEIYGKRFGKVRSLFSSIYSRKSARDIERIVSENRIDIALVHNIFPLISPSIFAVLNRHGVETRLVCHNYRILCPNGIFYTHDKVCEKCCGRAKELHSIINRCEGSILGSIAYALRNFSARVLCRWQSRIDKFLTLTDFQRDKYIEHGIDPSKIVVTGNSCGDAPFIEPEGYERNGGVLFVGRLSQEKGVETLLKVAKTLPHIRFTVAGGGEISPKWGEVSSNIELKGNLSKGELIELYRSTSITIITSHCYEGFPLVVVEASLQRSAVIAPNLGSSSSIIRDGITGLHYTPGDIASLKDKIETLLDNPEMAKKLSKAAQKEALDRYSTDQYYSKITQ